MAMKFLEKLFGSPAKATLSLYQKQVEKINALEPAMQALSLEELQARTFDFKKRIEKGESLDDLLPEAFATVREASKRTLGQRHYDVQLIGGQVLHHRKIAEMRTGEGKTLVATLPAYLNALAGKGVHVVTVNDYLARRDAVWMGEIYAALGMKTAVINHDSSYIYDESHNEKDATRDTEGSFRVVHEYLRPCTRTEAYAADITYGTNSEFGFDYLRDNIQYNKERVAQREPYYALVDEVDSILIDEARTPLIISAPAGESENLYATFASMVASFEEGVDYILDEKKHAAPVTDAGIEKAEKALGVESIYTEKGLKYVHHLETAIKAKSLYKNARDYVIKDGEAIIVDQSTGRLQPGRRWSEGLHQAIEAKEGVSVRQESRTFASVTYQNYFRLYKRIAGMTGTATTSAEEFYKVYGLEVISVPTHRPLARKDHEDLIFQNEIGKFKALARKVRELNQKGQPVLIGTVSIEKNELLAEFLRREGIPHEILNAKNHEREGEITAQAGRKGAVTLATNLAGRGVDIKLGGATVGEEEAEEVRKLGGLFVLGTERHEARRIDNQLRGRSGRQGDPGETQFFVSLEDPLMRIFGSDKIKTMMGRFGIPEDEPIASRWVSKSIEGAQTKVEGLHFDSRKHVLEYDDVLNFQRLVVYERRRKILFGDEAHIAEYLETIAAGDEGILKVLEEKKKVLGETFAKAAKILILQVTDMHWVDHLEMMDYLRGSVRLRAYGQRDPLIEYKREGLQMYKQMEESIADEILRLLPNLGVFTETKEEKNLRETQEGAQAITRQAKADPTGPDAGRNDPCPCGSGKKYKKCHGA